MLQYFQLGNIQYCDTILQGAKKTCIPISERKESSKPFESFKSQIVNDHNQQKQRTGK